MSLYWYNFGGNCKLDQMDYVDSLRRTAMVRGVRCGESGFEDVEAVFRSKPRYARLLEWVPQLC